MPYIGKYCSLDSVVKQISVGEKMPFDMIWMYFSQASDITINIEIYPRSNIAAIAWEFEVVMRVARRIAGRTEKRGEGT